MKKGLHLRTKHHVSCLIRFLALIGLALSVPFSTMAIDAYEPNNAYGDATPVSFGIKRQHSINPAADEDWFVMSVVSGRTYRIKTSIATTVDVGLAADTVVYLYDDQLTLLDFDDDDDDNLDNTVVWPYSLLEYKATANEVLYIRVKCLLTSSVGDYTFEVIDMSLGGGGGVYGTSTESGPAIAFDERGWPIIAYVDLDADGFEQVFVKRWLESIGDYSSVGQWISLSGDWYGLDGSVAKMQVSQAAFSASYPAIAVDGPKVYITWKNKDAIDEAGKIYLACWDGAQFLELGDSMTGYGISPTNQNFGDKESQYPMVGVGWDDQPVVGYQQAFLDPVGSSISYNQSVIIKKYDGTNSWRGLDGSVRGAVPGGNIAFYPDMDMDDNGYPVVVWGEPVARTMNCYRWTGSAWAQAGTPFGGGLFAEKPAVVAGPASSVYVSWLQYYAGNTAYIMSNDIIQVYAAQLSGSTWTPLGESMTPPSFSDARAGGRQTPNYLSIDINTNGRPMVAWLAGAVESNGVLFAEWNGTSWSGIGGSGEIPGLAPIGGIFSVPDMAADRFNRPGIVFFNEDDTGAVQMHVYKLGGKEPPVFQGLREVESTTNGYVVLKWDHATSPDPMATYTSVTYHIYRSDLNNFAFAGNPDLDAVDVFDPSMLRFTTNIATSVTAPQFVLYPPELNRIYGFGVRAEVDGLVENNTAIRYGAATNANVLPQLPVTDLDGDGIDDAVDPNPTNPDVNGNGVPDGDEQELGWPPAGPGPFPLVDSLIDETFAGPGLPPGWTLQGAVNLWHYTLADPSVPGTNPVPMHAHSTDGSFRCARNVPPNDTSTTYDMGSQFVRCSLITAPFFPGSGGLSSLIVAWNEFYDTESQWDICNVAVKHDDGGSPNPGQWKVVRSGVSGNSGDWIHREVDITDWYNANIQPDSVSVRFEFITLNNINNAFHGWYVDDVQVYGTPVISGNVRDLNGDYVVGANIYAIGLGNVTNNVNGQLIVKPGTIFAQTATDSIGNYTIRNIPQGQYYVKADAPQFRAEFWKGDLYGAYGFGNNNFGQEGVHDVRLATALAATMAANATATCNFELEPGEGRSFLGIYSSPTGSVFTPRIDQVVTNARIWNGVTTAGATNLMLFQTDRPDTATYPDYDSNPIIPNLLGDLGVGEHIIYMNEGSSVPLIKPVLREGEVTRVYVSTNNPTGGTLNVLCDRSGDAIFVDGINSGTAPASITGLAAGWHEVVLRPGGVHSGVTPVEVLVSTGGTSFVNFDSWDVWDPGETGGAIIKTVDLFGRAITGATVYIDGVAIPSGLLASSNSVTPLTLTNLRPDRTLGSSVYTHRIVVHKDGYRWTAPRSISVSAGVTNTYKITLTSADIDYDNVKDALEISSYTNIFFASSTNDPDGDGLINQLESDQFDLNGTTMNLNNADTDGDFMSDFDEFNYDGNSNWVAISELASNITVKGSTVYAYFRGRFLEGESAFNLTAGPMSIEGDEFLATNVFLTFDSTGVPVYRIQVPTVGLPRIVVSENHLVGDLIYADTIPDVNDSDTDLMWDGFEYIYMLAGVTNLSPINNGAAEEDPDNDGLTNYREFLGTDRLAGATNDWSNPGSADSDNDGMPDGWEYDFGLNPVSPTNNPDAGADMDSDGLTNLQEYQNGTDPTSADSDADGLDDGAEINIYGTDATLVDSDGDGLWDGQEVVDTDLDPSNGEDGGFFARNIYNDMDGDGLPDGPLDYDSDGDGMPDGFEVLGNFPGPDGLRPIRDILQRLDPLNALDADIDSDGDGLTNLQEYLVRDGLFGNMPDGFLWDYSTDPFNPDSDGDGMPDGWEVMKALHPQDPVPTDQSSNGLLVREEELWLYGDLDGDGLHNLQEYTVRFLGNPSADPYAIEGSCDPRNWDSDADGLADGEEVKTYRSSPLKQDSDNDGLIDGVDPMGIARGEVSSLTNAVAATNAALAGLSYDRALNDLWSVRTVGPPTHFTVWEMHMQDKDPALQPVWGTNNLGVIVIDVTNSTPSSGFPSPYWQDLSPIYYASNYYYNIVNGLYRPPPDGSPHSIVYWFQIDEPGMYQIGINSRMSGFDDDDFWVRFNADAYISVWNPASGGTVFTFDLEDVNNDVEVTLPLFTGQNYLTLHPGETPTEVTQIRIFPASMSTNVAYGALAHSPIDAYRWDRPARRWGSVGSSLFYRVRDNKDGDYVGRPVSGLGETNQLLLAASQIHIAGGRDGSVRFPEYWRLRNLSVWELDSYYDNYHVGQSEVAMAAYGFASAWGNPQTPGRRDISRPRPGQATEYSYYDLSQEAKQLWGEDGVVNAVLSYYLTGWDQSSGVIYPTPFGDSQQFRYFPDAMSTNSATWAVHDATEKWGHILPTDDMANKHHGSDFSGATYTWRSDQFYTVVQTNDSLPQGQNWVGWEHPVPGGPDTNIYVSGIVIENVLNTRSCYSSPLQMLATLNFATLLLGSSQTGAIPVRLYGEVAYLNQPTLQDQSPHATWSSDPDYTTVSPHDRWGIPDGAYIATNNNFYYKTTNYVDFTIPVVTGTPGAERPRNVFVTVSDIVHELFAMTKDVAGNRSYWEYGNDMGFIMMINTNVTGVDPAGTNRLVLSQPNLKISVREPGWATDILWADRLSINVINENVMVPYKRKSSATVVTEAGQAVIFGGVDGNRVLDDTWVADPNVLSWTQIKPPVRPPARWGHSMIPGSAGAIMFGGFDKNNVPLNDLWVWDGAQWYEITHFANYDSGVIIPDKIKPRPRAGAFFAMKGGEPCLFGGTDGEHYFNDTWLIRVMGSVPSSPDMPWRWMLADPNGQRYENTRFEAAPAPRAFGAAMTHRDDTGAERMYIFGGRTGLLPTSTDTDGDWVSDKDELDLGGPAAGRDPRANAMIVQSAALNTNGTESLAYSFKHVGGVIYDYYAGYGPPLELPFGARTLIADFESLSHSHELGNGMPEWNHTYSSYVPFEGKRTPPDTIVDFIEKTGYDAIDKGFTNLWWHPIAYTNGAWELGAPDTSTGIGPPYAYNGRWCFGTDMDAGYPNLKAFELYSPIYSLTIPSADSTSVNPNGFYLVYHEWLDLKVGSSDVVKIEAIKPKTVSDVATRTSPGVLPVQVLPPRNYSYNTTGAWRRVVVPLSMLFNEPQVYFRFTLQAGDSGTSTGGAGWYIDDVAILQAAELTGTYAAGLPLHLVGVDGSSSDPYITTVSSGDGSFGFDGLIPAGQYQIIGGDGAAGVSGVAVGGSGTWGITVPAFVANEIVVGITINSPAKITWNSVAGATYEVQYCTPATLANPNPWITLTTVVAAGDVTTVIDYASETEPSRFYRVVVFGN